MAVVPCFISSLNTKESKPSLNITLSSISPSIFFSRTSTEWIQVSNNVKPGGNHVVLDLEPAVWYHLRVTAHNNAGFSVAEYEFATLTLTGGWYNFISFTLRTLLDETCIGL